MGKKVTLGGELMFPSEYLAAVEFKGRDVTLTIKSVAMENLRMRDGSTEAKPVLSFAETEKRLVLNKTNADSIAHLYGHEAKAWIRKRVSLYPTQARFGRETVDAIRVREKVPASKQASAKDQTPNPGGDDAGNVQNPGDGANA